MSKIKHLFVALLAASAFLLPGAMSVPQANAASPIDHPLRLPRACRLRRS